MEYLSELLPIIIYILLIVLIILLIIIAVKAIKTLNKAELIIEDLDKKVKTLDSFFSIIDKTTDKLSAFSDRIVNIIIGVFEKIKFKKKKEDKEKENDLDE